MPLWIARCFPVIAGYGVPARGIRLEFCEETGIEGQDTLQRLNRCDRMIERTPVKNPACYGNWEKGNNNCGACSLFIHCKELTEWEYESDL